MHASPASTARKLGSAAKEHSAEEWAEVCPIITNLYMAQGKTLSDVVEIMAAEHGFQATEAMYKKRFHKWGIFKNKNKRRSPVDPRLDNGPQPKHARVNAMTTETFRKPLITGSISIALPSPAGRSPRDPYLYPSLVLIGIRDWIDAGYASKLWDIKPAEAARGRNPSSSRLHAGGLELHIRFMFAFSLYTRGEQHLAGKAIRKAFLAVEDVISDDSPEMILHIIHIMVDLTLRKQIEVLVSFLKHFSDYAACRLPANHPLVRIPTNLRHIQDDIQSWLLRSLLCAMNTFVAHLGDRYTELPHLHWLKKVVQTRGEIQTRRNPAAVEQYARSYGIGPRGFQSSLILQNMIRDALRARHAGNVLVLQSLDLQQVMAYVAAQAMMGSCWKTAGQYWRDMAELESSLPWSHSISVIEKLWLSEDAYQKAGDAVHVEIGKKALRAAKSFLDDISSTEV